MCTVMSMIETIVAGAAADPVEVDPVRRIEADVAAAVGVLNAAHGRLVELAADLIERELWRGVGIKSPEHWLCWKAGLSPQRARQLPAIARRRGELPATVDTLSRGAVSLEQVAVVARYAPAHTDAEVASLATRMSVSQLRRVLSRYRFGDDQTDPESARPGADGNDSLSERDAGAVARGSAVLVADGDRFGLHVDAPADDGAMIAQALTEAKDALFQAGHPSVTWMHALIEVCNRSLTSVESAGRAARFRTYVHLDTAGGWLNAGPALPAALIEKLTCEGVLQPVWETEGVPVSVGRSHRIVPDRTRRLVLDRDRGCVVPGCDATVHLEVHHLLAWSSGGRTDLDNLACLCPFHHDALHRGELSITGDPNHPETLRFVDADGRVIPPLIPPVLPAVTPPTTVPRGPDTPALEPQPYRNPTSERLQTRWIHFTPPDQQKPAATAGPNAPP